MQTSTISYISGIYSSGNIKTRNPVSKFACVLKLRNWFLRLHEQAIYTSSVVGPG